MTRIDFYHYTSDKFRYACGIASKAFAAGNKVCVHLETQADVDRFDDLLWTYQPLKFVPHMRLMNSEQNAVAQTPVLLITPEDEPPHHDVLINLANQWPPKFASFERLIEVVANSDDDKVHARERYKFYKHRGYEIQVQKIDG